MDGAPNYGGVQALNRSFTQAGSQPTKGWPSFRLLQASKTMLVTGPVTVLKNGIAPDLG